MRLRVENFGPIHKADVNLNKLTVIIGKNNIGKSYLAQLHYTVMECSRRTIRFPSYLYRISEEAEDDLALYPIVKPAREQLSELAHRIKAEKMPKMAIMNCIVEIVLNDFAQRLQANLRLSLESSFGIKIGNLVNINARTARIKWDILECLSVAARISKSGAIKVDLSLSEGGRASIERSLEGSKLLEHTMTARKRRPLYLSRMYVEIRRNLFRSREARLSWQPRAYYIPAGRGGLLESYETVLKGLVSLSPRALVRGLTVPPLPGMASQFYTVLLGLQGERGPMSKIVKQSFQDILQGDVHLKKPMDQPKARLIYRFHLAQKTGSMSVIHAASMIKELAPIYLIVQELIKPSDFLIIEEPESHLHPGAQITFAYILSRLVQNGVNVLFTTHSDLLLREIGHIVARNRIEKTTPPFSSLEVAICWLKESDSGSVSEPIKLPRRGVIEDIPTFDEVVRDLYKEEQALERDLNR
jgi:predicted ATPase